MPDVKEGNDSNKNSVVISPQAGMKTPIGKQSCSICWSPMEHRLSGHEVSPRRGCGSAEKPASVTKTKCGHVFHRRCLMESKMRSAQCPNCRAPLTPITNPTAVTTEIERSGFSTSTAIHDAIIHASHRARNAVRAALKAKAEAAAAAAAVDTEGVAE